MLRENRYPANPAEITPSTSTAFSSSSLTAERDGGP